jgi:hypothetical protein
MINAVRQKKRQDRKFASKIKPADSKPGAPQKEYGGPKGKEPTRYGDWEKNGRCIDF